MGCMPLGNSLPQRSFITTSATSAPEISEAPRVPAPLPHQKACRWSWEGLWSMTGGSARRSRQRNSTFASAGSPRRPPPPLEPTHHQVVVGWQLRRSLHPSVRDIQSQIRRHDYKVQHPKVSRCQVHTWTPLCLNMLFVMDNLWRAQKSSNRTPLWFKSGWGGGAFFPVKPLQVSLSLPTWASKSGGRGNPQKEHSCRGATRITTPACRLSLSATPEWKRVQPLLTRLVPEPLPCVEVRPVSDYI